MVSNQEAVNRLVAICPEFQETWLQRRDNWGSEQGGHYNDLGALATWMVDQMEARKLGCFDDLFDELETLLEDQALSCVTCLSWASWKTSRT